MLKLLKRRFTTNIIEINGSIMLHETEFDIATKLQDKVISEIPVIAFS